MEAAADDKHRVGVVRFGVEDDTRFSIVKNS
jgi:hypothetical protein